MSSADLNPFEAPKAGLGTSTTFLDDDDPELVGLEIRFRQIRNCLAAIAILYAVEGLISLAMADDVTTTTLVAATLFFVIHAALWWLANPMPRAAVMIACIVFFPMTVLSIIGAPLSISNFVRIPLTVGLITGLTVSRRLADVRMRRGA